MSGEPLLGPAGVLSAGRLNELVDAVNLLMGIKGGPAVKVDFGQGGIIIGLDLDRIIGRMVQARISAVSGGSGPGVASTFTYSVKPYQRPELPTFTNMTPAMGRPVKSSDSVTEIYPAAVDDRCWLFWEPDGDGTATAKLWIGTEVLAVEDCAPAIVFEPNDLSMTSLLDHVLVDRHGDVLIDRHSRIRGDRHINSDQQDEFLDGVLIDRFGRPIVDRFGRVLLDRYASAAAHELWDAVLTDRFGEVRTDRYRCVLSDRSTPT